MKFKLTEEHVERLTKMKKEGHTATSAAKLFCQEEGIEYTESLSRLIRMKLSKRAASGKIEDTEEFRNAMAKSHDSSKTRFIVSWAQNDTPVNDSLMDNIEAYAKHIDAEILIILGRYVNPSLFVKPEANTWSPRVLPYAVASRIRLHKYLQILGDVKTQPTAVNPLSGLQAVTGLESTIIGHPKVALESLPVLEGYPHKILMSTGAVTAENYSDTSAGKKGEFHHALGFAIVELDGEDFYLREVTAKRDGSFCDLNASVSNGVVDEGQSPVDTVVLGDIHAAHLDQGAFESSMDMLVKFQPSAVMVHDLFDGHSISHHHKKDPFVLMEKEMDQSTLSAEISLTMRVLERLLPFNPVVVSSNHNDHLDQFLRETDWRKAPNGYIYLKLALAMAEGHCPKGALAYLAEEYYGDKVTCLGSNDSYRRCGVELGIHGNFGANGSRGSVNQYKYFNTKMICGHTHTPRRQLGYSSAGTLSKLRLDYNKGASSWMHSNVILHTNGKRQTINLIGKDKKFTTLKY